MIDRPTATCRPARRTLRRTLAAVGLAGLLASCGVATGDSADRAPGDDVPFGLLDADPTPGDGSGSRGRPSEVFLFDSATGRLRTVVVGIGDGSLDTVVKTLQQAPAGDPDVPSGNPLADTDTIREVTVTRGVATVDLTESFNEISGSGQLAAFAQIVYTATARPGVGQVAFTLDGQPSEVLTGDGALESRPRDQERLPGAGPGGSPPRRRREAHRRRVELTSPSPPPVPRAQRGSPEAPGARVA